MTPDDWWLRIFEYVDTLSKMNCSSETGEHGEMCRMLKMVDHKMSVAHSEQALRVVDVNHTTSERSRHVEGREDGPHAEMTVLHGHLVVE